MPVRKPVSQPALQHGARQPRGTGGARSRPSRAFYVDCLGYLVGAESPTRSICGRSRSAIIIRSCCANPRRPRANARLQAGQRGRTSIAPPTGSTAATCRPRFPTCPSRAARSAPPMSTACRSTSISRWTRAHGMLQRYAAYQGARIQRIDHINCFTPDVQASYDFYTEFGFRLTEYTETDDTPDPQALGGVAAPQGQRPRPRLHQWPRPAPAPHRRLDRRRARHPRTSAT